MEKIHCYTRTYKGRNRECITHGHFLIGGIVIVHVPSSTGDDDEDEDDYGDGADDKVRVHIPTSSDGIVI